jgi:hypothetical protein
MRTQGHPIFTSPIAKDLTFWHCAFQNTNFPKILYILETSCSDPMEMHRAGFSICYFEWKSFFSRQRLHAKKLPKFVFWANFNLFLETFKFFHPLCGVPHLKLCCIPFDIHNFRADSPFDIIIELSVIGTLFFLVSFGSRVEREFFSNETILTFCSLFGKLSFNYPTFFDPILAFKSVCLFWKVVKK